MTNIATLLILHEGERLKPYTDTVGKLTIGVGRNLTDNGITQEESRYLLAHDIQSATDDLYRQFSWYPTLDSVRQTVLVDMCFNLGINRLKGFHNMLTAFATHNYTAAADAMLDSKWATQVGRRAVTLAAITRTGLYVG